MIKSFFLVSLLLVGCVSATVVPSNQAATPTKTEGTAIAPPAAPPASTEVYARHPTPQEPRLIDSDRFQSIRATVPPFPAAMTRDEFLDDGELIAWQLHRTPEQCAMAAKQVYVSAGGLFEDILKDKEQERLKPFFAQVQNDAAYFITKIKDDFGRLRPFVSVPGLQPCISKEVSKAYPSGHAALAHTFAFILKDFFPSRKKEILERAFSVGQNRILGGVHFPSDVKAGENLAKILYQEFKKNKAYQSEFLKTKRALKEP